MEKEYASIKGIDNKELEVDKAKDLLWKYIDSHNKQLLIETANSDILERNGLELKCINLGYIYV